MCLIPNHLNSTANNRDRIELEKQNAQLSLQVSHLNEEIKRLNEEKMKKVIYK